MKPATPKTGLQPLYHASFRALLFALMFIVTCAQGGAALRVAIDDPQEKIPAYTRELLVERLARLAGERVEIKDGRGSPDDFLLLALDAQLAEDLGGGGYRIAIAPGGVRIDAAGGAGVMYGVSRFLEWLIGASTSGLSDPDNVDIDFPTRQGQAARLLANLPRLTIQERPFYPLRVAEFQILALGVADLLDGPLAVEKYNTYSGVAGGFKESARLWKRWCDWLARHRFNGISNWPYSAGANWWELALNPDTAGMSPYRQEDIAAAITRRRELLAYARSRGLAPYLMNYVPGAPTETIKKNHPELVGKKFHATYPEPFDLASSRTGRMFESQIAAIARTYPEMAGLHFRWWGESFLDPKDGHQRLEDLTLAMMRAAKAARPDLRFLMSGYFRMGGTKAFADQFPEGTIVQTKWGIDWEPVPDPAVPLNRIAELKQPLLISQCVPSEEFHSLGGIQYRSLGQGVKKYARAADAVPNLAGFALMVADAETEWITGLDFTVLAHLNWNPNTTDVPRLVDQYLLVHYGARAGKLARQAMELTQDALEEYVVNFDGVAPFVDCARIHDMFGLSRVKGLSRAGLAKGLVEIKKHADLLVAARKLMERGQRSVTPAGRESYRDLSLQTRFYAEFLRSRLLMVEAFAGLHERRFDSMRRKLAQVERIDRELVGLGLGKPNLADDFEMEGMKRWINLEPAVKNEIKEIGEFLKPANMKFLETTFFIHGTPDTVEVLGNVGTSRIVRFELPKEPKAFKGAILTFTTRDLDGLRAGDEGVLRIGGREWPLEPTGDGQTKANSITMDPAQFAGAKALEAQFILQARPGGTAGYFVSEAILQLRK